MWRNCATDIEDASGCFVLSFLAYEAEGAEEAAAEAEVDAGRIYWTIIVDSFLSEFLQDYRATNISECRSKGLSLLNIVVNSRMLRVSPVTFYLGEGARRGARQKIY